MKLLSILAFSLFSIACFAQSWQPWIDVGYGIQVSFKYGKEKCGFANTYARLKNSSSMEYATVRVGFKGGCNTTELSVSAYRFGPGAIYESAGNHYATDLNVADIRLTHLLDAERNNLLNSAGKTGHAQSGFPDSPEQVKAAEKLQQQQRLAEGEEQRREEREERNRVIEFEGEEQRKKAENDRKFEERQDKIRSSLPPEDPKVNRIKQFDKERQTNNDAVVTGSGQVIQMMGAGLDARPGYDEHYAKKFMRFGVEFGLFAGTLPILTDCEINTDYLGIKTHRFTTSSEQAFIWGVNVGSSLYPIYSENVKLALNGTLDGGLPVGASGSYISFLFGGNLAAGSKKLKLVGDFMIGNQYLTYEILNSTTFGDFNNSAIIVSQRTNIKAGIRYCWVANWYPKQVGAHVELLLTKENPKIDSLLIPMKKNYGLSVRLSFDDRFAFTAEASLNYPGLGSVNYNFDDNFKPTQPYFKFTAVRRFVF